MEKGIDVSRWQGKIDWAKVKQSGVAFAMLRAGYGMYQSQEDPYFKTNVSGTKMAGIPIGAYWYSYAVNESEAQREADTFLSVIRNVSFTYPLFFDQEYEPSILALTNKQRTDICIAFIRRVTAAGYRCGIYGSKDWLENKIDVSALGDVPVWVAQYSSTLTYQGRYDIWQYGQGSVLGISGAVDLDYGYFDEAKKDGWSYEDGEWYYYEDGRRLVSRWLKDDGFWYYLKETGAMAKGFLTVKGVLYYLNPSRYQNIPTGALIITDPNGGISE